MTTTTKFAVSQATAALYRAEAAKTGDPAMAAAAERVLARAENFATAADDAALLAEARAAMNAARQC